MESCTLYTYPENFRAYKILIAAEYSGKSVNLAPFKFGETNKSEDFLKKFPLGKVPAVETSNGVCLYESNAIASFVASDDLNGKSAEHRALVRQYVEFAENEILPSAATWVFPTLGLIQYNKQNTEAAMEQIKKCMTVLNSVLLTKTFLVGERVTLADISVCCNLLMLYKQVMDAGFRAPYGNVNRWFNTMINQPQVKKVIGEFQLCTTMAKFDAQKFNELHPKVKQDKKKEDKKQKKEEKPKQEKKPKKEEVDPFAGLPPTKFVMDNWKKVYSNNDTLKVSIPYFWENVDKEGYSVWLTQYKYEDELTLDFMTCNLVGGMMQRLDKLRKNAFASICIFGQSHNMSIRGIWLFRGQQCAFDLNEDWRIDSPSYSFTKLDLNSEEDKFIINQYLLCEDGDFSKITNLEFNQCKIFK